jgi:hypothetical protein
MDPVSLLFGQRQIMDERQRTERSQLLRTRLIIEALRDGNATPLLDQAEHAPSLSPALIEAIAEAARSSESAPVLAFLQASALLAQRYDWWPDLGAVIIARREQPAIIEAALRLAEVLVDEQLIASLERLVAEPVVLETVLRSQAGLRTHLLEFFARDYPIRPNQYSAALWTALAGEPIAEQLVDYICQRQTRLDPNLIACWNDDRQRFTTLTQALYVRYHGMTIAHFEQQLFLQLSMLFGRRAPWAWLRTRKQRTKWRQAFATEATLAFHDAQHQPLADEIFFARQVRRASACLAGQLVTQGPDNASLAKHWPGFDFLRSRYLILDNGRQRQLSTSLSYSSWIEAIEASLTLNDHAPWKLDWTKLTVAVERLL